MWHCCHSLLFLTIDILVRHIFILTHTPIAVIADRNRIFTFCFYFTTTKNDILQQTTTNKHDKMDGYRSGLKRPNTTKQQHSPIHPSDTSATHRCIPASTSPWSVPFDRSDNDDVCFALRLVVVDDDDVSFWDRMIVVYIIVVVKWTIPWSTIVLLSLLQVLRVRSVQLLQFSKKHFACMVDCIYIYTIDTGSVQWQPMNERHQWLLSSSSTDTDMDVAVGIWIGVVFVDCWLVAQFHILGDRANPNWTANTVKSEVSVTMRCRFIFVNWTKNKLTGFNVNPLFVHINTVGAGVHGLWYILNT